MGRGGEPRELAIALVPYVAARLFVRASRADIGCNPEADMELATDLFHQESGQDGMHENALEKLIHTDFFNSFRDDFDDSDMS